MDKIENLMVQEFDEIAERLKKFLIECNVTTSVNTINNLLKKLNDIVAIRKDKEYLGVGLNELGYIVGVLEIDGILEKQELPVDITAGYYKYEKGNFILDEKMKLERRG